MAKPMIAGIFLIDTRLLSSIQYLSTINESLLKFNQKFPDAYISIGTFDTSLKLIMHFQKIRSIPRFELTVTTSPIKIFDAIGQLIEKTEWLLPIYDISQVYVWIASYPKDQGSNLYTIFDIAQMIEQKRKLGWHFYFPFAQFECLRPEPFHIL